MDLNESITLFIDGKNGKKQHTLYERKENGKINTLFMDGEFT